MFRIPMFRIPMLSAVLTCVLICVLTMTMSMSALGEQSSPKVEPIPGGFFVQWDENKPADVTAIQLDPKISGSYELMFDPPDKDAFNKPFAAVLERREKDADPERDSIVELANYWLSRNKPERAIPLYEKGLQKYPDNFLFLNNLAMLYSRSLNQHEKGLEIVDRALTTYKDDTRLLDTKGLILMASKDFSGSQKVLQRAVELSCQNPVFCLHLSYAYIIDGQEAKAKRYLDAVKTQLEGMEEKKSLTDDNVKKLEHIRSVLKPKEPN